MTKEELKNRTKHFALRIIKLVDELPNTKAGNTTGNQIVRAGTSVGANYRSACRARSNADFISKITIVEEECDETSFWLELIEESKLMKKEKLTELLKEANELTAILQHREKQPDNQILNIKFEIPNNYENCGLRIADY
jgi:four helix bundle protein